MRGMWDSACGEECTACRAIVHVMRLHMWGTQPEMRYAIHALAFDGKLVGQGREQAQRYVAETIQDACESKHLARHRLWHSPWGFIHYSYDSVAYRDFDRVVGDRLRNMCFDMGRELGPKLLVAAMEIEPAEMCVERLGCRYHISFTEFAGKVVWNALHDVHVFWCCIPWLIILAAFPFLLLSCRKHKPFPRAKVRKEQ